MRFFKDKKVLFITTKNLDYIRNSQEIDILKEDAKSLDVIGYEDKSYPKRLMKVYKDLLFKDVSGYDVIFIGFAPQLIVPLFNFKFKGKVVVIDFFISVYDTMVHDRKKVNDGTFPAKMMKWLDMACIRSAKIVMSDTNAHGDYFARDFKVNRNKIKTLYLKADEKIYYPRESVKPDKLKDKFVVLYFGSVLPVQGVKYIMGAMDMLKNEKDIYFYFIGPVSDDIEKAESDNIEYIHWLSQEDLAECISYADLCLAGHFDVSIGKARRTIPGKAYIYEMMRKPMILGDSRANRELFKEDDYHYFVEMSNSTAIAYKILEIKSNCLTNR